MKKCNILSITVINALLSFGTLHSAQKIEAQAFQPLIRSSKSGSLLKIQAISKNNKAEKLAHERIETPIKAKEIEIIEFQ